MLITKFSHQIFRQSSKKLKVSKIFLGLVSLGVKGKLVGKFRKLAWVLRNFHNDSIDTKTFIFLPIYDGNHDRNHLKVLCKTSLFVKSVKLTFLL